MALRTAFHRDLSARDHLDKVALVLAFLIGSAGSWTLKFLGFGPFWAMGCAVGAMLAYVAAVTALGRLQIEPEAIGDNCYYLGFLLTLSSLSATLYQLTQSEEQTELMRSVVAGFGIALVSTILGILLRVIFIQLRPDIVARDRETRIELQQAARELRVELAMSIATMKTFSTEAIQLASEQGLKISEATALTVDTLRERMNADAEAHEAMLRTTLEQTSARTVAAISTHVTRAGSAAEDSIRASLTSLSRSIAAYADANAAAFRVREEDDARAEALADAALRRTRGLTVEIEALSVRVTDALGGIRAGLESTVETMERAGSALADAQRVAVAGAAGVPPAPVTAGPGRDLREKAEPDHGEGGGAIWFPFRRR